MRRYLDLANASGPLSAWLDWPDTGSDPEALILLAVPRFTAVDRAWASILLDDGHAVLCTPLLTDLEQRFPDSEFNTPKLSDRLLAWLDLLSSDVTLSPLPWILLSHGGGSPAALRVAVRRDQRIQGIACAGGPIDQAGAQTLRALAQPLLVLAPPDEPGWAQRWDNTARHLSRAPTLVSDPALAADALRQFIRRFP